MTADNPPAFPAAIMQRQADGQPLTGHDFGCGGMSLRDCFAAAALTGFVANDKLINTAIAECTARHGDGDRSSTPEKVIAERCLKFADAMLSARTPAPATGDE